MSKKKENSNKQTVAQKIEQVPILNVKPYWRNPRSNEATVGLLKKSIEKYGFNVPLVVDRKLVIITGHARYKAAMELGFTSVPCIVREMNEKDAKEYRILDNKVQEATKWDNDQLYQELREFEEQTLADFFPELDIDVLQNYMPDTQSLDGDDIEKTKKKLENHFSEMNKNELERKIRITCPHCYKEFAINKEDVDINQI